MTWDKKLRLISESHRQAQCGQSNLLNDEFLQNSQYISSEDYLVRAIQSLEMEV